jgi:hypothetical protein
VRTRLKPIQPALFSDHLGDQAAHIRLAVGAEVEGAVDKKALKRPVKSHGARMPAL